MRSSTFIWAFLFFLMAGATGGIGWQLISISGASPDNPERIAVELGLPRVAAAREDTTVSSDSAFLWDTDTRVILYNKKAFERRPIASITKLMSAMVALDFGIDWDHHASIRLDEYVAGGRLLLSPGETATMRDLFTASLLGSANNATLAYVRETGIEREEFVRAMNRKAIELGLEQTEFVDVTGLSPRNVSTAYEVARMAQHAFTHYPDIAHATSQSDYTFTLGGSQREHTIRTTNKLISDEGATFTGSKTGYIYEAGWCLVVQGGDRLSHRIAVVLGSASETDIFTDVQKLLQLFPPPT